MPTKSIMMMISDDIHKKVGSHLKGVVWAFRLGIMLRVTIHLRAEVRSVALTVKVTVARKLFYSVMVLTCIEVPNCMSVSIFIAANWFSSHTLC